MLEKTLPNDGGKVQNCDLQLFAPDIKGNEWGCPYLKIFCYLID